MNSKERLTRIFQGKEVDRPALKLWGLQVDQEMLHPAYKPVYDLAVEVTDIVGEAYSRINVFWGTGRDVEISIEERPLPDSKWVDRIRYVNVGGRKLRSIFRYSKTGEPGYDI